MEEQKYFENNNESRTLSFNRPLYRPMDCAQLWNVLAGNNIKAGEAVFVNGMIPTC